MPSKTLLPAPAGLAVSGRHLWQSVAGEFHLDFHEQLLLTQACRCADYLDRLAVEAASGAVTVENHKGDQVGNPAMVESRQQFSHARQTTHLDRVESVVVAFPLGRDRCLRLHWTRRPSGET